VTVPRVMEPLLRPQEASAGVTTMAVGPGILDIGGGGELASVGIFHFDAVGTGSQSGVGGGSGKRGCNPRNRYKAEYSCYSPRVMEPLLRPQLASAG